MQAIGLESLGPIKCSISTVPGYELDAYKEKTAYNIKSLYENLLRMFPYEQSCEELVNLIHDGFDPTQAIILQTPQQQRIPFKPFDKFGTPRAPVASVHERRKDAKVEFLNLSDLYEKIQRRIDGVSKQRIINGLIHMSVTCPAQLQDIEVYVEKCPEDEIWGADEDEAGRLALPVTMGTFALNKQYLSVDLDSVYFTPSGEPFYKLSRVHANQRNLFRLVTVLVFIDGTRSHEFYSKIMRLRSRKSSSFDDEKGH